VFADTSERPRSYTADRTEFLGRNGSYRHPTAARRGSLAGRCGPNGDPCLALQTSVALGPSEDKEILYILGVAADIQEARRLASLYRDLKQAENAWQGVNQFWDRIRGALTVHTPNPALDLLMNHWLLYQVLSCRIWARSALYQSGGAYGF